MKADELNKQRKTQTSKVNRAYWSVFSSPDGQLVVDDLMTEFGDTPLKKTPDGTVDASACLVGIGSQKVVQTIIQRIEDGKLAR